MGKIINSMDRNMTVLKRRKRSIFIVEKESTVFNPQKYLLI